VNKKSFAFIIALMCLLGWTPKAHAYFDPGTGSMVLQLLLASILGFLFTLKTYWEKLKGFLKNLVSKNSANDSNNPTPLFIPDLGFSFHKS
jgi:hypothetical protein